MAETEMEFQPDIGSDSGGSQHAFAQDVKGKARKKVLEKVDAQKSQIASSLEKVADSIAQAGEEMNGPPAQIASQVATYVRKAEQALEGKSTDELLDAAIRGVKERPAVAIAGAFFLGFLGARFLKS